MKRRVIIQAMEKITQRLKQQLLDLHQTLQDDMQSAMRVDHPNPFAFKTAVGTEVDIEATNHQTDLNKTSVFLTSTAP